MITIEDVRRIFPDTPIKETEDGFQMMDRPHAVDVIEAKLDDAVRHIGSYVFVWGGDHIPLTECEHGHIYKLDSRNLSFGAFDKEDGEFLGIRYKFGDRFIDREEHWDLGPPHGTAKPVKDMGTYDGELDDRDELFAALDKWEQTVD